MSFPIIGKITSSHVTHVIAFRMGLLIHTEAKNFISVNTLNHYEYLALARERPRIFLCIHSMD